MDENINCVAKRIRILPKSAGISQKELADFLGYNSSAISDYESGQDKPSIEV